MGGLKRFGFGSAALVVTVIALVSGPAANAAGSCSSSTPQYCPAPVVSTGSATIVATTSALVSGSVNPNGSDTSCAFAYGTTTSYGHTTAVQGMGAGSTTVNVAGSISGLSANTTYHYQLFCFNLGGLGFGGDMTFKTAGQGASNVQLKTGVALVGKKGKVGFKITCNGPTTCSGTLALNTIAKHPKLMAPRKHFTIGAHKTKTVTVTLKKTFLNQLKNSKSHKRKAKLTVNTTSGSRASRTVTLKLRK